MSYKDRVNPHYLLSTFIFWWVGVINWWEVGIVEYENGG